MSNTTYTTFNEFSEKTINTSLQSVVTCSYNHLVDCLGEPTCKDSTDNKTYVEWHVQCEHGGNKGAVLTVYDYKNPVNPTTKPNQSTRWHVGGKNEIDAMGLVQYILRK